MCVSAPTHIKAGLMKEILWSSVLTDPTAGLICVTEGGKLSLESEIGSNVFPKPGLTRSKSLLIYLYMDLFSFPMLQAYSHSKSSHRAISVCPDILGA